MITLDIFKGCTIYNGEKWNELETHELSKEVKNNITSCVVVPDKYEDCGMALRVNMTKGYCFWKFSKQCRPVTIGEIIPVEDIKLIELERGGEHIYRVIIGEPVVIQKEETPKEIPNNDTLNSVLAVLKAQGIIK